MDQRVEAVCDSLSDHFSSRDKFGVEPVEDVLEVLSLPGFLGIEELEELLDKAVSDVDLQCLNINCLIHYELEEELVNREQVRPGRVNQHIILND